MVFVACGLNHKTAPLSLREKAALSPLNQTTLLTRLLQQPYVSEGMFLSTCNRTEIYCETDEPLMLAAWFAAEQNIPLETLSPFFYTYQSEDALRHALRVMNGLDSMMLGESQIMGQMKQAFQAASEANAIKTSLKPLFPYLFSASKRIRRQSGLGNQAISVAYAAVQLIQQLFLNMETIKILMIGSGETSTLVTKYLHQQGSTHFYIASRTAENASRLAGSFGGETLSISEIPHYLAQVDVVISATACPLPFINKQIVEQALAQRASSKMFFLDLSMPRDIEADVASLDGVHLYNIDDLNSIVSKGMEKRLEAADCAQGLIEEELNLYQSWHRSLQANAMICDYRRHMRTLARQELTRAQKKLSTGQHQDQVLDEFCERLLKKLIHHPTTGLRQAASKGPEDLLDFAHTLFNPLTSTYEEVS